METLNKLELDFSNPEVASHVNRCLRLLDTQHPFYSGLIFCKEWLDGNDIFTFNTSGSTGKPQPISFTRDQVLDSVKRTTDFFHLSEAQDVFLCLNTHYTGGKMMLARALKNRMRVFWVDAKLDPFEEFPLHLHFTLVALMPSQMLVLCQRKDHDAIFASIDRILLGGAPVPEDLRTAIAKLIFPSVYETFGMTETLSHIALKRLNGNDFSPTFRLLDGIHVKTDERGCLMIKAIVTGEKWVTTNDIIEWQGQRDFVWICRADNVVNSGGIKIHLERLEKELLILLREQGIKGDFMLGALQDTSLGEKLVLYIEETPPIAAQEILHYLKERLPAYHTPKEIIQLEKLPRTVSGKLQRIKT